MVKMGKKDTLRRVFLLIKENAPVIQAFATIALVLFTLALVLATDGLRVATENSGIAKPVLDGTFITNSGEEELEFHKGLDITYTFWIYNVGQLPVNLDSSYPVYLNCSKINSEAKREPISTAIIGFRENDGVQESSLVVFTDNRYFKISISAELIEDKFEDGCELEIEYWPMEFSQLKKAKSIPLKEA
ncbi:hypothetical protein KKG83_06565 [Candidatus Micrarchaeota archaeon]|nr:hypothetical protein [Candidatus Micrarchaeota archaeon]